MKRAAVLFASGFFIFLILEVLPGDPALIMLGVNADPETLNALRQTLNLEIPWYSRYFLWLADFFRGDWGVGFTYGLPVKELVLEKMGVSLRLAIFTQSLILILAVPLGIFTGYCQNFLSRTLHFLFIGLAIAIPNFLLGILAVLFFSVYLGWFPAGGFSGEGGWADFQSLILPGFSLAIPQTAILAKVIRSSVHSVLQKDFVRTVKSKGASNSRLLLRHVFPNALIPVLTIFGLQFSFLIAGTILIENVFYLPGLGRLIFQSLSQRDLVVIKTILFLLIFIVTLVNLSVDFLLLCIDPRIRKKSHEK